MTQRIFYHSQYLLSLFMNQFFAWLIKLLFHRIWSEKSKSNCATTFYLVIKNTILQGKREKVWLEKFRLISCLEKKEKYFFSVINSLCKRFFKFIHSWSRIFTRDELLSFFFNMTNHQNILPKIKPKLATLYFFMSVICIQTFCV